MSLTRQQKLEAQRAFAEGKACEWCGGLHQRKCNRVKRQVWHPNSALIELEFFSEWKQPGGSGLKTHGIQIRTKTAK